MLYPSEQVFIVPLRTERLAWRLRALSGQLLVLSEQRFITQYRAIDGEMQSQRPAPH